MEIENERLVQITTGDHITINDIRRDIISQSVLINEMLLVDEDDDCIEIPLPNVDKETFIIVYAFLKMHKTDPMPVIEKPLKFKTLEETVGPKYTKFIYGLSSSMKTKESRYADESPKEKNQLNKVIMAANYLDIQQLLELGVARIAFEIKDKSPEEVYEVFNVGTGPGQNPLPTEDEMKEIREKNKWLFDINPTQQQNQIEEEE